MKTAKQYKGFIHLLTSSMPAEDQRVYGGPQRLQYCFVMLTNFNRCGWLCVSDTFFEWKNVLDFFLPVNVCVFQP